jgi:hypothetical protein
MRARVRMGEHEQTYAHNMTFAQTHGRRLGGKKNNNMHGGGLEVCITPPPQRRPSACGLSTAQQLKKWAGCGTQQWRGRGRSQVNTHTSASPSLRFRVDSCSATPMLNLVILEPEGHHTRCHRACTSTHKRHTQASHTPQRTPKCTSDSRNTPCKTGHRKRAYNLAKALCAAATGEQRPMRGMADSKHEAHGGTKTHKEGVGAGSLDTTPSDLRIEKKPPC